MKKLILISLFLFTVGVTAEAQTSTRNEKKLKNTGCYSQKSSSEPKDYEKKRFSLAKVFASRSGKKSTENEKKQPCTEPRNPYANNEQSVIKSKYGIK